MKSTAPAFALVSESNALPLVVYLYFGDAVEFRDSILISPPDVLTSGCFFNLPNEVEPKDCCLKS